MKDWKQLLQAARAEAAQQVPKGFKSRHEIEKDFGLGKKQTGDILRKLVDEGKVEKAMFRVLTAAGVRPVPHYKIK